MIGTWLLDGVLVEVEDDGTVGVWRDGAGFEPLDDPALEDAVLHACLLGGSGAIPAPAREAKAARRYVRTPEGARRYAQPIGSLIVGDPPLPPMPKALVERDPDHERQVLEFVEMVAAQRPPAEGDTYGTAEAAILDHGRFFAPADLPPEILSGEPKRCFQNALLLVLEHPDEYTYVEGYAAGSRVGLPLKHAWAVDRDGRVVDPTWSEANGIGDGVVYLGIPLATEVVLAEVTRIGVYGVLGYRSMDFWANLDPAWVVDLGEGRHEFQAKALRRVRTAAGARYYGKPIGSLIESDDEVLPAMGASSPFRRALAADLRKGDVAYVSVQGRTYRVEVESTYNLMGDKDVRIVGDREDIGPTAASAGGAVQDDRTLRVAWDAPALVEDQPLPPAGETEEAKKLVKSVEDRIAEGVDPKQAVADYKKELHKARVKLIREKQKAAKAAKAADAAQTPPPVALTYSTFTKDTTQPTVMGAPTLAKLKSALAMGYWASPKPHAIVTYQSGDGVVFWHAGSWDSPAHAHLKLSVEKTEFPAEAAKDIYAKPAELSGVELDALLDALEQGTWMGPKPAAIVHHQDDDGATVYWTAEQATAAGLDPTTLDEKHGVDEAVAAGASYALDQDVLSHVLGTAISAPYAIMELPEGDALVFWTPEQETAYFAAQPDYADVLADPSLAEDADGGVDPATTYAPAIVTYAAQVGKPAWQVVNEASVEVDEALAEDDNGASLEDLSASDVEEILYESYPADVVPALAAHLKGVGDIVATLDSPGASAEEVAKLVIAHDPQTPDDVLAQHLIDLGFGQGESIAAAQTATAAQAPAQVWPIDAMPPIDTPTGISDLEYDAMTTLMELGQWSPRKQPFTVEPTKDPETGAHAGWTVYWTADQYDALDAPIDNSAQIADALAAAQAQVQAADAAGIDLGYDDLHQYLIAEGYAPDVAAHVVDDLWEQAIAPVTEPGDADALEADAQFDPDLVLDPQAQEPINDPEIEALLVEAEVAQAKADGTYADLEPEAIAQDLAAKGLVPQALYDHRVGQANGPGAVSDGRWQNRATHLPEGHRVPVYDLTTSSGHVVKEGWVEKQSGVAYLVERAENDTDSALEDRVTAAAATVQAVLEKVPADARAHLRGVALIAAPNPNDAYFAEKIGASGFKSYADGGYGVINVYRADTEKLMPYTVAHEFGHNLDSQLADSNLGGWLSERETITLPGQLKAWPDARERDAQTAQRFADWGFVESRPVKGYTTTPGNMWVTSYAATDVREDFAESVRLYLKDRREGKVGYLKELSNTGDETPSTGGLDRMNVRFADVWPERARILDVALGFDETDTPLRKVARDRIAADLFDELKDGLDPSFEEAAADGALRFGVPYRVAHEGVIEGQARFKLWRDEQLVEKKTALEQTVKQTMRDFLDARLQPWEKVGVLFDGEDKPFAGYNDLLGNMIAASPDTTDDGDVQLTDVRMRELAEVTAMEWNSAASKAQADVDAAKAAADTKKIGEWQANIVKALDDFLSASEDLSDGEGPTSPKGLLTADPEDLIGSLTDYLDLLEREDEIATPTLAGDISPEALQTYASQTAKSWQLGKKSGLVDQQNGLAHDAATVAITANPKLADDPKGVVKELKAFHENEGTLWALEEIELAGVAHKAISDYKINAYQNGWTAQSEQELQEATAEAVEYQASLADYKQLPADVAKKIRKKKAAVKFYAKKGGATPEAAQAAADEYELAALAEALQNLGKTPIGGATKAPTGAGGAGKILGVKAPPGVDPGGVFTPGVQEGPRRKASAFMKKAGTVKHAESPWYHMSSTSTGYTYWGRDQIAKDHVMTELALRLDNPTDWAIFSEYAKHTTYTNSHSATNSPRDVGTYSDPKPYKTSNATLDNNKYGMADDPGAKGLSDEEVARRRRRRWLYEEVSQRIGTWASTAGDNSPPALMMQHAVKDEFGLKADWGAKHLAGGGVPQTLVEQVITGYVVAGPFYRRVARVMYEHTQAEFAKEGVTQVALYRNMTVSWPTGTNMRAPLQPANSWAFTKKAAAAFGSKRLEATMPVTRVLGTARTGFGCLNEDEIVVMDSDGEVHIAWKGY